VNDYLTIPPPAAPSTPPWLITFADLISLVLTFFIMLFATRTLDDTHAKQIFGVQTGEMPLEQPLDAKGNAPTTIRPVVAIKPADNLAYLRGILTAKLKAEPELQNLGFTLDNTRDLLLLTLPADVALLPKLAAYLQYLDNRLEIELPPQTGMNGFSAALHNGEIIAASLKNAGLAAQGGRALPVRVRGSAQTAAIAIYSIE
jgi:chemotaxis protein MotB